MVEIVLKLATCVALTGLFYASTFKMLGILQQCGYRNGAFWRWLRKKDNTAYNRLFCWSFFSLLTSAFGGVCTAPLGVETAQVVFLAVFLFFSFLYCVCEKGYALKVPVNATKRLKRLSAVYLFLLAITGYLALTLSWFLIEVSGGGTFSIFAFAPLTPLPLILPFLLLLANAFVSPYEKVKNNRFVLSAKTKLERAKLVRIGIVGSYGKTSVKNILRVLLSEKYSVLATPESYNTPVGVAKTVNTADLSAYEIFLAEMGARRRGDIEELCELVKPDYALFTGVCLQHVETFKTEENLVKAKFEIVKGTKNAVVCGGGVKGRMNGLDEEFLSKEDRAKCAFVFASALEDVELKKTGTSFTIRLPSGERVEADVPLLGGGALENVALAATLAFELGLTAEEIARGIKKIQPIPHRLQLIESGGVYILDDSYNCNERSAREAISALKRFDGRKIVVTPGIVEGGDLEEKLNFSFGQELAKAGLDQVFLVGERLVFAIEKGYLSLGGDPSKLQIFSSLERVKEELSDRLAEGDTVLFLNDLPDVY